MTDQNRSLASVKRGTRVGTRPIDRAGTQTGTRAREAVKIAGQAGTGRARTAQIALTDGHGTRPSLRGVPSVPPCPQEGKGLSGQPKLNAEKPACKYGHAFTADNAILAKRPDRGDSVTHRHCRECHRRISRESWRRRHGKQESDG